MKVSSLEIEIDAAQIAVSELLRRVYLVCLDVLRDPFHAAG